MSLNKINFICPRNKIQIDNQNNSIQTGIESASSDNRLAALPLSYRSFHGVPTMITVNSFKLRQTFTVCRALCADHFDIR